MKKNCFFIVLVCFTLIVSKVNLFAQASTYQWVKSAGGTGVEYGYSTAADASGNVYVVGTFSSSTITFGVTTFTNAGGSDMYIVKYDANGNVLWALNAGTAGTEIPQAVAVDASGNAYVTGYFNTTGIAFGSTTLTTTGGTDIFTVKYNAAGSVAWAKNAGGASTDYGRNIAVDASSNVYVSGQFNSAAITVGTTTVSTVGSYDGFVLKYNSAGTPQWIKSFGGTSTESATAVTTDASGNVYATGWFYSASVTIGASTYTNAGSGYGDALTLKFDAAGVLVWSRYAGGTLDDIPYGIVCDANNFVYITGNFTSPTLSFSGSTLTNSGSNTNDIFITKYNSSGTIQWTRNSTGTNDEYSYGIDVDVNNNIYIAGQSYSATTAFGAQSVTQIGGSDIVIAKYNSAGTAQWARIGGGASTDYAYDVSIDGLGNTYVAGQIFSAPATFGSYSASSAGSYDMFVAKINTCIPVITSASTAEICSGGTVSIPLTASLPSYFYWYATNNIYTSGESTTSQSSSTLSNTLTSTYSDATGVTYYVFPYDNTASCAGLTQTVTVTVNPAPAISSIVASPNALCSGTNSTLSVAATAPIAAGYCSANTYCTSNDYIAKVVFGSGINRTSTCDNSNSGYSVFSTPNPTYNVNTAYSFSVTVTPSYNQGVAIWIDYNQDGVFSATENIYHNYVASAGYTYTGSTTIPSSAAAGTTRMRVRCRYNTDPFTYGECGGTNSYGETEDYYITISGGVSPLTYSWSPATFLASTSAASVAANAMTSSVTYTATVTAPTGCANTSAVAVTVYPLPVMTSVSSATVCSGGSISIPLTSDISSSYTWIASSNTNVTGESTAIQITSILTNTLVNTSTTAQTITYTVTPTSTTGSCSGTPQIVTVVVYPAPTMTSNSLANVCSGTIYSIPLTSNIAATYSWIATDNAFTTGESLTTQTTNTLSNNVSNNSQIIQTVTYTVIPTSTSTGNCVGTAQVITLNSYPTPTINSISASPNVICSGGSSTLAVTATAPIPSGYCTPITSCGTDKISSVTFGASLSNTPNCTGVNGYSLYTSPNPTYAANTAYVLNVQVTASGAGVDGVAVWIDYNQDGVFVSGELVYSSYNSAGGSTQTYSTSITIPSSALNGTTRMRIRSAKNANPSGSACSGVSQGETADYYITISGGQSNLTYTWSPSTFLSSTNLASVTATSVTATTSYTAIVAAVSGCYSSNGASISVNPLPSMTSTNSATICSGGTVSIPLTSNYTSTYTWIASNNANTSGESTTTQSTSTLSNTIINSTAVAQTVTYTVIPTTTGTSACTGAAQIVTVIVNPLPTMTSANSTTICSGGTVSIPLTSNLAASYLWAATDNTNTVGESLTNQTSTTLNNTITNNTSIAQTVTYFVLPTSTVGSCTGNTQTVNVVVNPKPNMTSSSAATICSGLTLNIPLSSDVNSTYSWVAADNTNTIGESTTNQNSATINNSIVNNTTTAQTVVFSVVPTSITGGCTGNIQTVSVVVNPKPVMTSANSVTICSGTDVGLTFSSDVAANYSWLASDNTNTTGESITAQNSNTLSNNITNNVTTAQTVTYNVTPISTTGACAGTTQSVSVVVNPKPSMTNVSSAAICSGGTVNIPLTSNIASSYLWIAANNANVTGESITNQSTATLNNTLINTSTTAQVVTYSVTPTSTGGSCAGNTQVISVTVNPVPVMSSASSASICSGGTVNIALTSNVASSYTWIAGDNANTVGESTTLQTTSTLNNTIANLAATSQVVNYTVTPTATTGGCVGSVQQVSVTVYLKPTMTSANVSTICSGATVSISLSSDITSTYSWMATNNASITGESTTLQNTPVLNNTLVNTSATAQTVTYTVTPTSVVGSCVGNNQTVNVTVNTTPSMTSANSATICSGGMVSIPLTSNFASTYSWITSDYASITGESTVPQLTNTLSNTLINVSGMVQTITYTVTPTATAAGNCAGNAQLVNVTINPSDDATFSYATSTLCQTGTNPSATVATAGGVFTASSAGLVFINTSTGLINLSGSTLGTYTVTYTTSGACPSSSSIVITITSATSATFSYNGSPYCQGATNPLPTYSGGSSAGTFTASPAGLNFVNANTGEINLSSTAAGTYTITNTIPASGGCSAASATTVVTINPQPFMTSNSSATICSGSAVSIPLTAQIASSFTWIAANNTNTTGESTTTQSSSTLSNTITNSSTNVQTVVYTVTPTASSGGCVGNAQTVNVTVNPRPTMSNANSATICSGANVGLVLTSVVASTYSWIANNNPNTTGESTTSQSGATINNTLNNAAATAQTVTYTVIPTSLNSCAGTAQIVNIVVNPIPVMTSANTATICSGGTVNIALSANVAATFSWIAADNTNTTGESTGAQSASVLNNTLINGTNAVQTVVYTITPTSTNGLCLGTNQTVNVVVNPLPSMTSASAASICSGVALAIPLSSNVASSYSWIAADNINTSGESLTAQSSNTIANTITNNATSAQSVVYSITPTSTTGACAGNAQTLIVSIDPAPVMTNANTALICSGGTLNIALTSNMPASYSWIAADNANTLGESLSAQSTSTINNTITSSSNTAQNVLYTITPTALSGSCLGIDQTITVSVNPIPAMTSASTATICSGNAVNIPLTSNVAGTFSWIAANNANTTGESTTAQSTSTINNTITNTAITQQIVSYTATPTSAAGCVGSGQVISLAVNPKPSMSSTSAVTICSGTSIGLALTSNVAATYSWIASDNANTTGESLTAQNGATLNNTITNNSATTQVVNYTVTPTTGACAGNAQVINVTVNPLPAMTNANAATICSGETVSIALTSNVVATYSWLAADNTNTIGESITTQTASSIGNTITNSTSSVQTVVFTVTPSAASCTGNAQTINLTVNPLPTITSASTSTICSGATASLVLTSNPASTYTWIAADNANTTGESTVSQTGSNINNTIINTTAVAQTVSYTVTPTSTAGACVGNSQSVDMLINPTPSMTSATSDVICSGSTVSIPLTSNIASDYTWIAANNTNTTGESLTAQSTITLNNTLINSSASTQIVTYSVTPVSSIGACAGATQIVSVSVSAIPTVTSTNAVTVNCGGNVSIALTSNVASSFTWIAADNPNVNGESTTLETSAILSNNLVSTGNGTQTVTYSVTPTSSAGNCVGNVQLVTATVAPANFNINFTASPQSGAPPLLTTFNNTTPNRPNYTFTWYFGDGTAPTVNNNSSVFHTYNANGLFDVKVIAVSNATGCTDSLIQTGYIFVTGGCSHTAAVSPIGPINLCQGQSTVLTCNTDPTFTYQWYVGGTSIGGATSSSYTVTVAGFYSVIITKSGCQVNSNAVDVRINNNPPQPIINATGTIVPCLGGLVTLTASNSTGATYLWSNSETTQSIVVSTPASYSVTAIYPGGCSATSSLYQVSASAPPAPAICMVTVDDVSVNNVIYWDKTNFTNVASFKIYRDTANNNFALIGVVPFDSLSQFVDTVRYLYAANGDPNASSWRYKLSTVDTCGNESTKSPYHQTIFLQNNSGNFSWSQYQIEGQPIPVPGLSQFQCDRDDLSNGSWNTIQTLSASSTAYTDANYASFINGSWRTKTIWSISCDPTRVNINTTRSNIKKPTTSVGISSIAGSEINIYPNPSNDWLHVDLVNTNAQSIKLYNAIGELVYQMNTPNQNSSIDVSNYSRGVYLLTIETKNGVVRKKVVLQ
jgi:PKD-like domain/GEVED domain/Secretion system C-terminal sorting domain/Beta-propeller repeat